MDNENVRYELSYTGEAEVTPAADPSCFLIHPGEVCPGLPHL